MGKRSGKIYPWGLKSLIHLGATKINLYQSDFTIKDEVSENFEVLGMPTPALFPIWLLTFI